MSKLLSVSLPDDLMDETQALARAQGKTKSELVREALWYQIDKKRWADLLEHTRELAEERGIGPEDVEALVDEVRRDRA
jgi:metal-responsive CopG/Arc/MetJ family transcriptional regulator